VSVTVTIPTPLRRLTGGAGQVTADGATLRELIEDLERRFPGMRERLLDEAGALRRFVNVFVGDEDVRFLAGLETPLEEGAQVSIVPAVAGGQVGPPAVDPSPAAP
jgi:molybdopterin synthase sulfur carrier subunit